MSHEHFEEVVCESWCHIPKQFVRLQNELKPIQLSIHKQTLNPKSIRNKNRHQPKHMKSIQQKYVNAFASSKLRKQQSKMMLTDNHFHAHVQQFNEFSVFSFFSNTKLLKFLFSCTSAFVLSTPIFFFELAIHILYFYFIIVTFII